MTEKTPDPCGSVSSTEFGGILPEQHDIPPDIAKVLSDNLWDLYAEEDDDRTSPNTN